MGIPPPPPPPPPADQVAGREEGVVTESRVFFSENTRRVAQQLLESEVPSVNFRGLMDPVSNWQCNNTHVGMYIIHGLYM